MIEKRKELVQEQNLGGHLYEDGMEDCGNYRYRRSNVDLRDKIVSIRQSRAQEQEESKAFAKSAVARSIRAFGETNLRLTVRGGESDLQSIY